MAKRKFSRETDRVIRFGIIMKCSMGRDGCYYENNQLPRVLRRSSGRLETACPKCNSVVVVKGEERDA